MAACVNVYIIVEIDEVVTRYTAKRCAGNDN